MFKKPVWDDLSFVTYDVWTWSAARHLNDAYLVLWGPKCAQKISPTPLHHHQQPEPLIQSRMDPCFHVVYDPTIWMSQQQSRLLRPGNVFQSSIVQLWWACAHWGLSFLFLADSSSTLLPFYQLEPVWPFSSDLCHRHGVFTQRTDAVFFAPFSVVVRENLKPARLAPTTTHVQSLKSPFFPVLMLVWTSADRLDHVYMSKCTELLPHNWLIRYLC